MVGEKDFLFGVRKNKKGEQPQKELSGQEKFNLDPGLLVQ